MHFPYARAKTIYQDEQDHVYITEMLTAWRQSIHPDLGFPGLRTLMLVGRDGPTLVSAHPHAPNRIRYVRSAATALHHSRAATVLHGSTVTMSLWRSPWRLSTR